MTVSPEVQAQVDKTRELTDLVSSVHQAMQALNAQMDDIKTKAEAIPVATASSGSQSAPAMSEEDKNALLTSVNDTQSIINQLKSDITANTPAETQGSIPPAPVSPTTDPSTVQAPASTAPEATPAAPAQAPADPAAPSTQADGTSAA